MMNNKQQVKENIGQVVQIHIFRKHDFINGPLYLSFVWSIRDKQ